MTGVRLAVAAGLSVLLLAASPVRALERIYLVRHAEKLDPWPRARELSIFHPLSEGGRRRAAALAARLKDAGIATIYASETTRTVATGIPLALAGDIPIVAERATIDPELMGAWLTEIATAHAEDRAVLIIGHSNTIPLLLQEFGAGEGCYEELDIGPSEHGLLIGGYDDLWVVEWPAEGCGAVSRVAFDVEE